MNKSNHTTQSRNANSMDLAGLPPLPPSGPSMTRAQAVQKALELPTHFPIERMKPALKNIAQVKQNPSVYDQSIAAVRGLLELYSVDELDSLLLSCSKREREVLLKSLIK